MAIKILIPLDGSILGEYALVYIEGFVCACRIESFTEFILFRVIKPNLFKYKFMEGFVDIQLDNKELKEIQHNALQYLSEIGQHIKTKGISVRAKVGIGNVVSEIVKTAEEEKVDMIAMSTHGRSGLGRLVFGSVTDRVLHLETHIPITAVKAVGK